MGQLLHRAGGSPAGPGSRPDVPPVRQTGAGRHPRRSGRRGSTNDRQNRSLAALEHTGGNSTVANAGSNLPYIVGVGAGCAAGWSGWVNSNEAPADGASATDG